MREDTPPTSAVLDYRSPGPPADGRLSRIVSRLRLREQLFFGKVALMFLVGVPASFLGPALAAPFVRAWCFGPGGYAAAFILSSIILIPLLYWYEHRTRGQYFMDAMRNWVSDGGGQSASSLGGMEMNRVTGEWILWIEILLFAPRLTIQACRHLRERARLRHVSPRQAAEVLVDLLRVDHGISPAEVAARRTDVRGTLDAILYLVFHDWVGISTDRRRVWVLTDAGKILEPGAK